MDLLSAGDGGSRSWHFLLWHQWVAALHAEAAALAHDPGAARRLRPERQAGGALDERVRKRLQPDGLVARSSAPRRTSARYIHRPRRELGGSRAPSFPVPRCMHYRPPGRSAHPIVPRQPETTLEG